MSIRAFLVACFAALLLIAGTIIAVLMGQHRMAERVRVVQHAASELVTVSLQGSILLAETRHAPERARRQWAIIGQRLDRALGPLTEREGLDVERIRRHFAVADDFYGEYNEAYLDHASRVSSERVEWLRQMTRGRLAIIASEAESALDRASASAASSQRMLSGMLVGTAVVLPLLLLVLMILVQRRVLNELDRLGEASEAIREGDLERPIVIGRRDEIGRLAQTMERMRRSLAEQARRLATNNALLQAKNEEVEAFVYAVSHDLRGPLVNLVGFTNELALSLRALEQGDQSPERLDEMRMSIEFVTDNASRLEGLIDALLRLSRTGRQELFPKSCDMATIVARVVAGHREELEACAGEVAIGELPPAWVDPVAATRIVENLVTNAIKYRDPARPLRLAIDGSSEDDAIAYRFRDNGLGFPPAARERLFMAFQRYHPDRAEGEGMGLIITKRLIERSSGTIAVDEAEQVGSLITVTLPAVPVHVVAADPQQEPA